MTSKEIIDGVILSINAQIARRKAKAMRLQRLSVETNDEHMAEIFGAEIITLERIEKDLIQVEMNAKISYMGIETKGGDE